MDKQVGNHVFVFNPQDNGGEQLILRTRLFDNGNGEIYINQEMSLQSYCNEASIRLYGASITSDALRRLANELDEVLAKAKGEISCATK